MKVFFERYLEITSAVIDAGKGQFILDGLNYITPQRTILLSDNRGIYSPFNSSGVFAGNYQNKEIEIQDDLGNVQYVGLIQNITEEQRERGTVLSIETTDILGAVLPFLVNAVDLETYSGFTVSGFHAAGSRKIILAGGSTELPVGAVVSFDGNYLPSYQVQEASSVSATTRSLSLDRGLEQPLADGQTVYFAVPLRKAPAQALYDALYTAFTIVDQQDRLDAVSFSNAAAAQADYPLWIFCRPETGVTLADYLGQITAATETFIRQNQEGQIECIAGWPWDGYSPGVEITDSEIILDTVEKYVYRENLLLKVNSLYESSGLVMQYTPSLSANDPAYLQYLPSKVWTPFPAKSTSLSDYWMLFSGLTSATYYSDRKLSYWKYGRQRIKFSLKPYFSGTIGRILIQQFDNLLLSMTLSDGSLLENEPVKVVTLESSGEEIIDTVIVERINYPTPGLAKP